MSGWKTLSCMRLYFENSFIAVSTNEVEQKISQISRFLGITNALVGINEHPVLGIQVDYALEIVGRIGSYSQIYERNLGQERLNGNCVFNPFEPDNTSGCLLIIPPLGNPS